MKRLGGGLIALLVWLSALALPVVAFPTDACAADSPRAVLVVDTGGGVHRYCVSLPDDEVSGLELITLAGEQHGLSYRFGYGGGAVCMLADVGTTGDDCFERYPDFWGYWRGSDGGWTWSSTGAGSTTVGDGDVEGWSWGSGSDGSSHPRPPETPFSSVCPVAEQPDEQAAPREDPGNQPSSPRRTSSRPASSPDTAGAGAPASDPRDGGAKRKRPAQRKQEERKRKAGGRENKGRSAAMKATPVPSPTPSPDAVLVSGDVDNPRGDTSVPTSGLAALALAGALGAGGFVIARRRRGPA